MLTPSNGCCDHLFTVTIRANPIWRKIYITNYCVDKKLTNVTELIKLLVQECSLKGGDVMKEHLHQQ